MYVRARESRIDHHGGLRDRFGRWRRVARDGAGGSRGRRELQLRAPHLCWLDQRRGRRRGRGRRHLQAIDLQLVELIELVGIVSRGRGRHRLRLQEARQHSRRSWCHAAAYCRRTVRTHTYIHAFSLRGPCLPVTLISHPLACDRVSSGSDAAIRKLIMAGADPHLAAKDGTAPFEYAKANSPSSFEYLECVIKGTAWVMRVAASRCIDGVLILSHTLRSTPLHRQDLLQLPRSPRAPKGCAGRQARRS